MKTYKIAYIIISLLLFSACSDSILEKSKENPIYVERARISASTDNDNQSRVTIDGVNVRWNENDKLTVAEIGNNNQFSRILSFKIDPKTISSNGKNAEFISENELENGKKYIAFHNQKGSIFKDNWGEMKIINGCFESSYNYNDICYPDDFNNSWMLQSDVFDGSISNKDELKMSHKSALLELNLKAKDGVGAFTINSIEISSSVNAFRDKRYIDIDGNYLNESSCNEIYGTTNSISVYISDVTINSENPSVTRIPVTFNDNIKLFDDDDYYTFTVYLAAGRTSTCSRPAKILKNGVRYTVDLLFDTFQDYKYESTDYSQNGKVITLQKATKGKGINIVIVGDGFIDKDMRTNGKYETRAHQAVNAYFSEEPNKSFKDRYNIYLVKAVSENEGIGDGISTIFETEFGEGTAIEGNDTKIINYAQNAVQELEELTIINIVNCSDYAGTCYMYTPVNLSISYCPYISGSEEEFKKVLLHETGHGFAKLIDEYEEVGNINIPQSQIDANKHLRDKYGWYKNVDYTSDPNTILWKDFLVDPLYDKEDVDIYEGGATYQKGAWRSSANSIMRYNVGGFNAVSRNIIYKHIMKLSGETYTRDNFVTYDAINRTASARSRSMNAYQKAAGKKFVPFARPVVKYMK